MNLDILLPVAFGIIVGVLASRERKARWKRIDERLASLERTAGYPAPHRRKA